MLTLNVLQKILVSGPVFASHVSTKAFPSRTRLVNIEICFLVNDLDHMMKCDGAVKLEFGL